MHVIQSAMTTKGIHWHFNSPGAPHMGGVWERMVGAVKKALKGLMTERAPHERKLRSILLAAAYSVNSRPLLTVSDDPNDDEVLTPNHFLIERPGGIYRMGGFTDSDLNLTKSWRFTQRMADHFWKRWLHEYIPTLIRKSKWQQQTKPLEKGDLDIIMDENLQRNC